MDIQKEFKDLDTTQDIPADLPVAAEPEKADDTAQGDKIIKDLEARLAQIKSEPVRVPDNVGQPQTTEIKTDTDTDTAENDDSEEETVDDETEPTLLEKFQPFILPICLTLFAIFFAGLFLYFFSKSRTTTTVPAITNTGDTEVVRYVDQPVVKTEPVVIPATTTPTCTPPQILNDAGDTCVDPPVETPPAPQPATFSDGTTTVLHVKFSYDKFNYDNSPRGIYLLPDQIFEGDFTNKKLYATNRPFANDRFFGVDRYMVSLIGSCEYVIDDAHVLVKNARQTSRGFTGNVVQVLDSSKPHVVCGAGQYEDAGGGDGGGSTDYQGSGND